MNKPGRSGGADARGGERRVYPRAKVRVSVDVQSEESTRRCISTNVSQNGVCCLMANPIPLFTRVRVSLCAPGDEKGTDALPPVECEGIIVRQEEVETPEGDLFETAIFFQEPPETLGDYLTSHVGSGEE